MSSLSDGIGLSLGGFYAFTRALPPGAMSLKELKAILADKRLEAFLDKVHVIESIIANERGYLVSTAYRSVQVDVIHIAKGIGPSKVELSFHEPKRIYQVDPIIELGDAHQAKDCLKFLQHLINSGTLWERIGPSDRLFKISRTDEGYLFVTTKGHEYTASFTQKKSLSFISNLWN